MLELIFQGFLEWAYGLALECWQYFSTALLDIMSMDFAYLKSHAPVVDEIMQILLAVGWALLIGNLVFQALKSMAVGLGFEGEDPKLLFARTFVFAFLLLASPQICEIGLSMTSKIIELLQIPDAVNVTFVDESVFGAIGAAWLLVIIFGIIVMFKVFKLLLEIAERYVILATGTIIGVDLYARYLPRSEARMLENKRELCAVVVPYRIPILIRESEMWELGEERPDFVLRNMVGASIDVIVTKVERTANRAQASRRQASRSQRRFFAAREDLHAVGSRITCRMLAVGPRRCLVDCYGYDLDMTQREIRYAAIPDLRTEFHPGSEIDCIVKEYHPRTGELIVSAKETEVNPFFGAEERHPVGSRRFAMISGKYGGGVFCNLPDGVTCMCNYSYQHEDADFMVGEHVMLMVQRYDQEKLQMYGKIMSKW